MNLIAIFYSMRISTHTKKDKFMTSNILGIAQHKQINKQMSEKTYQQINK